METAWADQAILDSNTGEQDGRAYHTYITGASISDTSATGTTYLDHPYCEYDVTGGALYSLITCQMYLPLRDQQTDGYPRFDQPGVLTGYYIGSFIPTQEDMSFQKVTQLIQNTDWATTTSSSLIALVAAISAISF